jgi:hypothetical protein
MLLNIELWIEINFFHLILDIRVHYLERKSFHVHNRSKERALSLELLSDFLLFPFPYLCQSLLYIIYSGLAYFPE